MKTYIVFDLEATCWDSHNEFDRSEIIEIGAVKYNLVDGKLNKVDTFQRFVRPTKNPQLSSFCKTLTSITQENVDTASSFEKVFNELTFKGVK